MKRDIELVTTRSLPATAWALAAAFAWAAAPAAAFGDDDDAAAAATAAPAKPAMIRVEAGPMRIDVTLSGAFESPETEEVILRGRVWSDWTVAEAIEHGERVRKGDTLIELEGDKLEQALEDVEADLESRRLAIAQSEEELEQLRESMPFDLDVAEHSLRTAEEDLGRFVESGRAFSEKETEFGIRNSRNYLAYELEELEQLERMYKADDLTEETEEIILQRQRDTVEQARFSLERNERSSAETLEFGLSRRERAMRDGVRKLSMALEKARRDLPRGVRLQEIALEKQRREIERVEVRVERLREDAERLRLRAPIDGIVYYGRFVRGQWSGAPPGGKLARGARVQDGDAVLSIVPARGLSLRVAVPEQELDDVTAGLEAVITPTAYADRRVDGRVESVALVPSAPGSFDAVIALDGGGRKLDGLYPGMTASVRVTPYKSADALLVPASAVFAEELDPESRYVYEAIGDDPITIRKQEVRVGRAWKDKLEIVRGLQAGDRILAQKPDAPR